MNTKALEIKIKEYREYKRMIDETKKLADTVADELKDFIEKSGESSLIVGEYKLQYTDVTRKDLDKKRLETEHEALYKAYLKETTHKRFSVT